MAWRVGEINHLLGTPEALKANAADLPAALAAAEVFKPEDGVFFVQRRRLQQELAVTALRQGQAELALKQLTSFPPTMPPNPEAATDLAEVFLLRAQALRALGRADEALQTFEAGHAALKAAAERTPGNVQLACRLIQARLWAAAWARASTGGRAAALTALAEPAAQGREALRTEGKLSALWAKALDPQRP